MSHAQVDWNQRYIESDTPWDSGVPSEELIKIIEEGWVDPCRMLEVGCGTGTNAIHLARQGFQVTGVDLSDEALKQARDKAETAGVDIRFVQADVTSLPDLGEQFEFVFDRGTYHIVRQVDLSAFQKMLRAAVRAEGIYVVLAGNGNETAEPEQGPPRVRSHEVCLEIEDAGFDLLQLRQTNFHGVKVEGRLLTPMAWSAVFRRRTVPR